MSFCAGFYYYQGEVKNARKMQLAGGRGQPAARRGKMTEDRGQEIEVRGRKSEDRLVN
jgi:hypothetical protein